MSTQRERITALEAEIARLRKENADLKTRLAQTQTLLTRALNDLTSMIEKDTP